MIFFFNDTATTEIYTLSLHDALPICNVRRTAPPSPENATARRVGRDPSAAPGNEPSVANVMMRVGSTAGERLAATRKVDRKSTRLNSSHANISYAVFCLKKKKNKVREGTFTRFNHAGRNPKHG